MLLGRLDRRGVLRFLTHTHRLRAQQRRELAGLQPMAFQGDGSGHPWPCPLPAAWTNPLGGRTPLPFTQVEPTLVVEIDTDISTDGPLDRPRHPTRMLRVRPDLHPDDIARL